MYTMMANYEDKISKDGRVEIPKQNDRLQQVLTDALMTIGPQLLSVANGKAKKYRYVLDTAGTGTYVDKSDSTHGDELCYFHQPEMEHWNKEDGGYIDVLKTKWVPGGCQASADPEAAKMLRQYWTTFAKTGVPTSKIAADNNVDEWKPVNAATRGVKNPEDMLGMPYMMLDLSKKGAGSKMMTNADEAWSSRASAELLA